MRHAHYIAKTDEKPKKVIHSSRAGRRHALLECGFAVCYWEQIIIALTQGSATVVMIHFTLINQHGQMPWCVMSPGSIWGAINGRNKTRKLHAFVLSPALQFSFQFASIEGICLPGANTKTRQARTLYNIYIKYKSAKALQRVCVTWVLAAQIHAWRVIVSSPSRAARGEKINYMKFTRDKSAPLSACVLFSLSLVVVAVWNVRCFAERALRAAHNARGVCIVPASRFSLFSSTFHQQNCCTREKSARTSPMSISSSALSNQSSQGA